MAGIDDMGLKAFIHYKIIEEGITFEDLSVLLKQLYPNYKGLSVRSLQRFCKQEDIHKTSRIEDAMLDDVVKESVEQVGATYGRKTMTGLLNSKGIKVSELRVGKSLARVNIWGHLARQTATARQTNPVPYNAAYFGEKLHIDQNEKLVNFGITHVCAVDGYSRMIVGFATMCIKNNVEIYRQLYQPVIQQYGIWDQLRVDHGKEWYLILATQEKLSTLRNNQNRPSYLQTTSKMNHPVERIWVEINSRVNYPIKTCLLQMEERNLFNMQCEHTKFCISYYTIKVSIVGTSLAVNSWNNHKIPGKGIPNEMMKKNNHATKINPLLLPSPEEAAHEYGSAGGHLTISSQFGDDPLKSFPELTQKRNTEFLKHHNYQQIFYNVVNGNQQPFMDGLLHFIEMSEQLAKQL